MKPITRHLASLLPTLIVSIFFLFPMADADLGWHLRLGDDYLSQKTLQLPNTYSAQMPNYIWPNHSWGFDILLSLGYRLGGLSLLSLLGAILIGLSFGMMSRSFTPPQKLLAAIIFIVFNLQLLTTGLRSQLISLVFFAYLFSVMLNPKRRLLYTLPWLFLVWANLHGQHLQAFGLFSLFCLFETYRTPRSVYPLIWVACFITLLINPFGFELFAVTAAHLSNPALKQIYEWMPWEFNTLRFYGLFSYFIITGLVLFKTKYGSNTRLSLRLLVSLLGLWALTSRRMIPFFLITSMPLTIPFIYQRYSLFSKFLHQGYWLIITLLLTIGIILASSRPIYPQTWDTYCHTQVLCSESLIQFLQTNHIQGKILNSYRLGGHLIYRYPEIKVYIDGRMTVWQDPVSKTRPFLNYLTLIHNYPGGRELFYQENFDYVIIHPQFELTSVLANTLYWPKIFDDGLVQVYRRPEPNLIVK